jgi:hypothetical protein
MGARQSGKLGVVKLFWPSTIVAVLLSLMVLACSGDSGNTAEPTPEASPTPSASGPAEQALGQYVESMLGKAYVEDCSKADAQRDAGKICSVFRGERGNTRAYALGPTFSEGTQWAFLQERGNQWSVVYSQPITRENAGIPGVPWPLTQGAEAVVIGAAPCLNVREGPGLNQKAVDCIADGAKIKIGAGPAMGDNIQWWQVEGRSGWVAADYLRYPDAIQ